MDFKTVDDFTSSDHLWMLIFVVTILLATVANAFILSTVFRQNSLRSQPISIFIVNFCLVGELLMLLSFPFSLHVRLVHHWPFGDFFCKIHRFLTVFAVRVATLTFFVAVVHLHAVITRPPMNSLADTTAAYYSLGRIWAVSLVSAAPVIFIFETNAFDDEHFECVYDTDFRWIFVIFDQLATIFVFLFTFVAIPFIYLRIKIAITGRKLPIRRFHVDKMEEKKLTTLGAIVYVLCWIPNGFNAMMDMFSSTDEKEGTFSLWLMATSFMLVPLICIFVKKEFRFGLCKLFGCRQATTPTPNSDEPQPNTTEIL